MIVLHNSRIVEAFEARCVGTRVRGGCSGVVRSSIITAIEVHETKRQTIDKVPGQYYLELQDWKAPGITCIYSGVGKHTNNPNDYVIRSWRGRCSAYLKRQFAAPCESAAAVVYTIDAYGNDPDVIPEEMAELKSEHNLGGSATHVLVALLAFAGPESPPGIGTFVRNLAFANLEEQSMTADEIRAKAKKIHEYHSDWATVAD